MKKLLIAFIFFCFIIIAISCSNKSEIKDMFSWNNIPEKAITDDNMARIIIKLNISKSVTLNNKQNSSDSYKERYAENFTKNSDVADENIIAETATKLLDRLPENEYRLYRKYRFIPMLAMEVSPKAYNELKNAPEVKAIYADLPDPLPIYQYSE